ncbi:MAG: amidohydrolase family protein [bacterium]|nr:amidohydrolase family protein [bacterium]
MRKKLSSFFLATISAVILSGCLSKTIQSTENTVWDKKFLKKPRYHDYHNHVAVYIAFRKNLNIYSLNYDIAIEEMMKLDQDKLNVVIGSLLDQDKLNNDIEKLPPILICHNSLHAFYMNKKGKEILLETTRNKFSEEFSKNLNNSLWIEKNLPSILTQLCKLQEYDVNDIENYFSFLDSLETYSTEEMLTPNLDFIIKFRQSVFNGRCIFNIGIKEYKEWGKNYPELLGAIKIFIDGSIAERTASITDGYLYPKYGKDGILIYSDRELTGILKYIESEKRNVAIHIIGDGGIEQLLQILEKKEINIPSIRIEHAMFITKEQAERCKKLGLILSMQPNFSYDAVVYKDILTPETKAKLNPFRMLIDEVGFTPGEDLIFGTDGMPQGIREAWELDHYKGAPDSQNLTWDEFTRGFTKKDHKKPRAYPIL